MKCVRCNHVCRPGAKFCEECGGRLAPESPAGENASALPARSHAVASGTSFEDRRQATVVFADISGFTELCAISDPEHVKEMLAHFYVAMDRVVSAYGGKVFDTIGDSVMAVFGAPVAHGNDPERAVRAALAMHAAADELRDCGGAPLTLHIGAARGEVAAGMLSKGITSTYSITGDAVNLSARLQSMAEPGETLVADMLYHAVSGIVIADNLGEHVLRGFAGPLNVWNVRALSAPARPLSPFVGREAEFARIAALIDAARTAGEGAVVIVRGNAGIGKSRLVSEVSAYAAAQELTVSLTQLVDFGAANGKPEIASLLGALLRIQPAFSDAQCRSALHAAEEAALVDAWQAPFVAALLDVAPDAPEKALHDTLDHAARGRYEAQALTDVLRRIAQRTPLLVAIEDAHWASRELLVQLGAIAEATARAPMVLVMTTRIEADPFPHAWRDEPPGVTPVVIDLAPLSQHDAALLANYLAGASGDGVRKCIDRAEGNPLFLEQLIKAHHEAMSDAVPPSIQSVVLERVDRLTIPERLTLQAASVIGARFSERDLQALLDGTAGCCDALVAADMIRIDGEHGFRFAHALIHEAVYASLPRSQRRKLHRRAAHNLGPDELVLRAEHLERAQEPEAAEAWLAAARQEMAHFRIGGALALARRGMHCARDAPIRCELSMLSAELLRELGESNESIEEFMRAFALATHDAERCRAWMGAAAGHRVTGDFDGAIEALSQAEPIAVRLQLDVECSRIHNLRGNLHYARGDVPACESEHLRALHYARLGQSPDCEVRALSGLGDAQLERGHLRAALDSFGRCVSISAARGWIGIEIPNRCMLGHCLRYAARLDEAIRETSQAQTDARNTGLVPAQVFAAMTLATILADAGDFDAIDETCREGLPLARAAGARRFESALLTSLAEAHLRRGRRDEARACAEHALALARQTGLGFAGAAIFAMLARTADNARQRAEALQEGAALMAQPCLAHAVLRFHVNAIDACIAAAEWDAVLSHANALETFMADETLPWAGMLVERARALADFATSGHLDSAARRLRAVRGRLLQAGVGSSLEAIDEALDSRGVAKPGVRRARGGSNRRC